MANDRRSDACSGWWSSTLDSVCLWCLFCVLLHPMFYYTQNKKNLQKKKSRKLLRSSSITKHITTNKLCDLSSSGLFFSLFKYYYLFFSFIKFICYCSASWLCESFFGKISVFLLLRSSSLFVRHLWLLSFLLSVAESCLKWVL